MHDTSRRESVVFISLVAGINKEGLAESLDRECLSPGN